MATHSGRCFFLTHIESNGESQALGFKLESGLAANAIYRAVTEKHAFYSCETVRNAVTTQFIRDLKGTIVSLFNENTQLGKNYVFDIRRTCREVYDHTRRELYQLEAIANDTNQSEDAKEMINNEFCLEFDHSGSDSSLCKKSHCEVRINL
jgi:E3 ubiquitin-protein ligase MYLIP